MTTPTFAVNPYRFSADPAAMIAFLETLGLRKAVTSEGEWFGLLRAGAGWVAVHPVSSSQTSAGPGETQLVLLTERAADAAAALEARGVHATVWDESYGQHAGVIDPAGGGVWINEHQADLYGYVGHDAAADPRLSVTMVRSSADRDADRAFFAGFGFESDPGANEWWEALRASPTSGVIGLHAPMPGERASSSAPSPFAERTSVARLGFETTEDLDELAARLTASGHHAAVVAGDARAVHVIDPDGCELEIHTPAS